MQTSHTAIATYGLPFAVMAAVNEATSASSGLGDRGPDERRARRTRT